MDGRLRSEALDDGTPNMKRASLFVALILPVAASSLLLLTACAHVGVAPVGIFTACDPRCTTVTFHPNGRFEYYQCCDYHNDEGNSAGTWTRVTDQIVEISTDYQDCPGTFREEPADRYSIRAVTLEGHPLVGAAVGVGAEARLRDLPESGEVFLEERPQRILIAAYSAGCTHDPLRDGPTRFVFTRQAGNYPVLTKRRFIFDGRDLHEIAYSLSRPSAPHEPSGPQ